MRLTSAFLAAASLLSAALSVAANPAGASLTVASTQKAWSTGLSVTQSVAGISSPTSVVTAQVGIVDFVTGAGLRQQVMASAVDNPGGIVNLAIQDYGDGVRTKEEIRIAARDFLLPRARAAGESLHSWMQANGVGGGTFVFQQEVQPKGVNRRMKLVWQIIMAHGGRSMYGDPKVVDGDPTVLYVLYTSKSVAAGLPASWQWPEAGTLRWQLRRQDGTPVSAMTTIDTGGAFDEPQSNGDPDWGVKCIADPHVDPTCPAAFTAARALIEQTSSIGAVIDYVRMVQPVYDEATDPAEPGSPVYVPRMSLSYDTREVKYTACAVGSYRNAGRYGFTLATTVDRFLLAEGSSHPQLGNRFSGTSISPTVTFDESRPIAVRSASLQSLVIDPFEPQSALVNYATLSGVTYVAPLTVPASSALLTVTSSNSPHSVTNHGVSTDLTIATAAHVAWNSVTNYQVNFTVSRCDLDNAKLIVNQASGGNLVWLNGRPVSGTSPSSGVVTNRYGGDVGFSLADVGQFAGYIGSGSSGAYFSGHPVTTNISGYSLQGRGRGPYQANMTGAISVPAGTAVNSAGLPVDLTAQIVEGTNILLVQWLAPTAKFSTVPTYTFSTGVTLRVQAAQ